MLRILLLICLGLTFLKSSGSTAFGSQMKTDSFINNFNAKVVETISEAKEVSGLKQEEWESLKNEILATWHELLQNGVVEINGTDKDIRPPFVGLQAIIEHVLSNELGKEVHSLYGAIHTPMPATPLCTKGEVSKELVDPTIEKDPCRLYTVKARTTIVRDLLHKGGYLFVIYPKEGMSKRTPEQQAIYKQELLNYPQHLLDRPLNSSSLPDELVGATYLFTDPNGNRLAFSIKMTQAKDPKENGSFGLWFGPLENGVVNQRVNQIVNFINQNGVKDFKIDR